MCPSRRQLQMGQTSKVPRNVIGTLPLKNKKAELRTYLKHLDDRLHLSFRFKRKGKILPWQQDHCQHWHSALTHDTLALCHLKCTSVDSKPGVMAAYG